MNTQVLIYIILALAAGSFVWTLVRDILPSKRKQDSKAPILPPSYGAQKQLMTLKMQAYERIVLFLERMKADRLLQRLSPVPATSQEMRHLLVQIIQAEYDHNLSQQIYVSAAAWEAASTAKEQTISLINGLAQKLDPAEPAVTFNRSLVTILMQDTDNPIELALQIVNSEAKKAMAHT